MLMLTLYFNVSSNKIFLKMFLTSYFIASILLVNESGANVFVFKNICVRFVTQFITKAPFKLKKSVLRCLFISSVKLKGRMKIE